MSIKTLESDYIYQGKIVALRDKVELPSGKITVRRLLNIPEQWG